MNKRVGGPRGGELSALNGTVRIEKRGGIASVAEQQNAPPLRVIARSSVHKDIHSKKRQKKETRQKTKSGTRGGGGALRDTFGRKRLGVR